MSSVFQLGDVSKLTGIPKTRLKNWLVGKRAGRTIRIKPSVRSSPGHGAVSLFNQNDVFKIAVARELLKFGTASETVQNVIDTVSNHKEKFLKIHFKADRLQIEWSNSLSKMDAVNVISQFVLNVAEIRKEVDEAIQNYKG